MLWESGWAVCVAFFRVTYGSVCEELQETVEESGAGHISGEKYIRLNWSLDELLALQQWPTLWSQTRNQWMVWEQYPGSVYVFLYLDCRLCEGRTEFSLLSFMSSAPNRIGIKKCSFNKKNPQVFLCKCGNIILEVNDTYVFLCCPVGYWVLCSPVTGPLLQPISLQLQNNWKAKAASNKVLKSPWFSFLPILSAKFPPYLPCRWRS